MKSTMGGPDTTQQSFFSPKYPLFQSIYLDIFFFSYNTLYTNLSYNSMKESQLGHYPYVQMLMQSCMDECKTPIINSMIRRGYSPLGDTSDYSVSGALKKPSLSSGRIKTINTMKYAQAKGEYPWTALGTVIEESSGQTKYLGAGAIIGENCIITLRFIQLYDKQSSFYFIPFFPQNSEERHKIETIFPSHSDSSSRYSDSSHGRIAILLLSKQSHLEENYGSLGFNFKLQDHEVNEEFIIAGIRYKDRQKQELIIGKGSLHVEDDNSDFQLELSQKYGLGSFLIKETHGDFFIGGITDAFEPQSVKAILFTKPVYDKLTKLTFQGFEIDLSQNPIKEKELGYLKHISMKEIVSLNFQTTNLGYQVLRALGRDFPHLEELTLTNNALNDDCLEYISSTSLKHLTHFFASTNVFTSIGMRYLSRSNWKNLTKLQLNNNPLGSKGVLYLSKNKWLLLESLSLNNTRIDNLGCEKLRKTCFPAILEVSLKKNRIGGEGLKWIVQADWPKLKYLDLGRNQLMEEGVKQALRGSWQKLRVFHFESNRIKWQLGIKTKLKSCFKGVILS